MTQLLIVLAFALVLALHHTDSSAAPDDSAGPVFRIVERSPQPVVPNDKPWESLFIGWTRVHIDRGLWRMWYLAVDAESDGDHGGVIAYAQSPDGLNWVKPVLGHVTWRGRTDNNIVVNSADVGGVQGHDVVIDPDAPPAERYKLLVIKISPDKLYFYIHAMVSPDGLHWTPITDPIFKFNSDTQNALIKEGSRWRLYVRMWDPHLWSGERVVGLSESDDFRSFPKPRIVFRRRPADPAELQFYNPALSKLRDSLYVILPSAFMTKRNVVEPHLAWSRDGLAFHRVGDRPFLPLRPDHFDSRSIYVAPGAVPGPRPNTWWFFYTGSRFGHDNPNHEPRAKWGAIGRFLLEVRD